MRRWLPLFLVSSAMAGSPAGASESADTTCFQYVPAQETTWGQVKTMFGAANRPRAARRQVDLGPISRYAFWADEHVDLTPGLFETHRDITKQVVAAAAAFQPTFFIQGGDMVDSSLAAEWDTLEVWMDSIHDRVLAAGGNHEGFATGGLDRYAAYAGMPGFSAYGYAFAVDDVQAGVRIVIGYSGYIGRGNAGYFAWLEEMFRTPNDWFLIYVQHNPPYSLADRGGPQLEAFTTLVPLFNRYKGDLFLAGHSHHMEVYRPSPNSALYVVAGTAGMELSPLEGSYPPMDIAEQYANHGYVEIEIMANKAVLRGRSVASAAGPGGLILFEHEIPRQCMARSGL